MSPTREFAFGEPALESDEGHGVPFLDSRPVAQFEYGRRPYKDVFFSIAFGAVMVVTVAAGLYAVAHASAAPYSADKGVLDDWRNCLAPSYLHRRSLAEVASKALSSSSHSSPSSAAAAVVAAAALGRSSGNRGGGPTGASLVVLPLVLSVLAAVAFGFGYVALLRRVARPLVYATVALLVATPVAVAVAALCSGRPGVVDEHGSVKVLPFVALAAAAGLGLFFANARSQLELTVRLVTAAAEGLRHNASLLLLVPGGSLLAQLVVSVPLCLFIAAALLNQGLVPNPELPAGAPCGPSTGQHCCAWETRAWVPYYAVLALLALAWLASLLSDVRLYVVSSTIAQWYWSPVGTNSASVKLAIRHAVGPSLGSLCFSSLVLTAAKMLQSIARQQEREARESGSCAGEVLACCLRLVADCVASCVEFVNKFAVVAMATRGDSFLEAARVTAGLLLRNALSAVTVDRLSVFTMALAGTMLALVWGALTYVTCVTVWLRSSGTASSQEDTRAMAVLVAVLAGVVMYVVFSSFAGVILNVIDTLYVLYASDKDRNVVTLPAFHEIYEQVAAAKGAPQAPPQTDTSNATFQGYPEVSQPQQQQQQWPGLPVSHQSYPPPHTSPAPPAAGGTGAGAPYSSPSAHSQPGYRQGPPGGGAETGEPGRVGGAFSNGYPTGSLDLPGEGYPGPSHART